MPKLFQRLAKSRNGEADSRPLQNGFFSSLFEAIRTRRSIRSFTDEPVSQEDLDRMLEAAMCAPSANNRQLWHFVVIRDREMLRKVAEDKLINELFAEIDKILLERKVSY